MANNNQPKGPKYNVMVLPSLLPNNKLQINAQVTKDGQPFSTTVQLYIGGVALIGASGQSVGGTFSHTIDITPTTTQVLVKAETSLGISKEVTVNVPLSTAAKPREEMPILTVESNRRAGTNTITLSMALTVKGKMVEGNVQFIANELVEINYFYPRPKEKQVISKDTFEFDGKSWTVVDITFDKKVEVDLLIQGWSRKLELNLVPFVNKKDPLVIPLTRPLFAGFCIFALLTALLTGNTLLGNLYWTTAIVIAGIISLALMVVAIIKASEHNYYIQNFKQSQGLKEWFGWFYGKIFKKKDFMPSNKPKDLEKKPKLGLLYWILGNNNWWLICLWFLLFVSFVSLVLAKWGPPLLTTDSRDNMTQAQKAREYIPGDQAQRIRNTQRNLGPVTDRSLVKQQIEQDWTVFWTRLIAFLILLVFAVAYIFVAFSDEAKDAGSALLKKTAGDSSEGTAGPGIVETITEAVAGKKDENPTPAPVVAAGNSNSNTKSKSGGLAGQLLSGIGTSFAINIVLELVEEFIERIMKKRRGDSSRQSHSTGD